MPDYPTTTLPPDSASSPAGIFQEPVTAPGLRVGSRRPPAAPSTPSTPSPIPSAATTSTPAPLTPDPIDSGPVTRSTADTPRPRPAVAAGALRDVARALVSSVGAWLADRFAVTPEEQANHVWEVQPKEAAGMGDPLADILERRTGIETDNPDVADLIRAGIAAAGYIGRNTSATISGRLAYRRARRAEQMAQQQSEQMGSNA